MLLDVLQCNASGDDVLGRTYDLKSAYKQMAISPNSLSFAYVVVFNPASRKPEIFQLLAAPFGATRSVYSFLRVIHSVWFIGVKALGIVWSHFFDDFVTFCRSVHSNNTAQTVDLLFKLLGWKYAEHGDKATNFASQLGALGVVINLEDARKGMVTFSNTDKRRTELVETITDLLERGLMTVLEAQRLRGRMQFMDGQIFGRLGRLCMRAVTEHAFAKGSMRLAQHTADAMRRFVTFLEHAGPRQLHLDSGLVWYIFTDACYEPNSPSWPCGLGGVLVDLLAVKTAFFSVCLSVDQMKRLGSDHKKTIIFEAELLALVLAFAIWKHKLMAQSLIYKATAKSLVGFLLKLEMATSSSPWYSRVPTPSNIADDPSRGDCALLLSEGVMQIDPTGELQQVMEVLNEVTDMVGVSVR
eukprot:s1350_g18.t1